MTGPQKSPAQWENQQVEEAVLPVKAALLCPRGEDPQGPTQGTAVHVQSAQDPVWAVGSVGPNADHADLGGLRT